MMMSVSIIVYEENQNIYHANKGTIVTSSTVAVLICTPNSLHNERTFWNIREDRNKGKERDNKRWLN